MTTNSTKLPVLGSDGEIAVGLLDAWFDPIEAGLRDRVRDFIQTMIESELEAVLSRPRYARRPKADPENNGGRGIAGHRHGHRSRSLLGAFGRGEIAVPRARLHTAEGQTTAWKRQALRAYQRRAPPTQSNGSTRSSGAGSKPRRCCRRPRLQRSCSGHCSPQVRSPCAKWTD